MTEPRRTFLFSGQGTQRVGMADALLERSRAARALFDEAGEALGVSLTDLVRKGPEDQLALTEYAQPAILTLSVAQARELGARGIRPWAAGGHSLGQYAALVVAGSLAFGDAVRLTRERGRLMQQAVPVSHGAMAAVIGLSRDEVEACCAARRDLGVVEIACHNAPYEVIVSGESEPVDRVMDDCEDLGASIAPLSVSVPFHCALLEPIVPAFETLVADLAVAPPLVPVVDNVTARMLDTADAVRRSLVGQITAEVRFERGLRLLCSMEPDAFVHCGPERKTMRRWLRGIESSVPVVPFEA